MDKTAAEQFQELHDALANLGEVVRAEILSNPWLMVCWFAIYPLIYMAVCWIRGE